MLLKATVSPRGQSAVSSCHSGWGVTHTHYRHESGEVKDATKHSIEHRTAPQQRSLQAQVQSLLESAQLRSQTAETASAQGGTENQRHSGGMKPGRSSGWGGTRRGGEARGRKELASGAPFDASSKFNLAF